MATRAGADIVKVPSKDRQLFLKKEQDLFIQSEDADMWERPTREEATWLTDFLLDKYRGAPKRFYTVRTGVRVGYDEKGVFLHQKHSKRYFGLDGWDCGVETGHLGDAVPTVCAKSGGTCHGNKSESLRQSMMDAVPNLKDDMHYQILRATFNKADSNGNGKLSPSELGSVFRRVLTTIRDSEIKAVIKEADTDGDGQINYEEFVAYLQKTANQSMTKAFVHSLTGHNEADMVSATFRLWDTEGNGLIRNDELSRILVKLNPKLTKTQATALVSTIDSDHDGNVDYDEFVDFLFHRPDKEVNT
jgi:Ca2+-binding EF-hand superfamily protein